MNKIRREVEVRGADIERAVNEGLEKLGLERSEAIVEVVDEGSRGLLGLGSRDAVVVVKEITPTGEPEPVAPPKPKPTPKVEQKAPRQEAKVESKPKQKPKVEKGPEPAKKEPVVEKTAVTPPTPISEDDDPDYLQKEQDKAIEIIEKLLSEMGVDAKVSGTISEPDDLTGKRMNIINITGNDLGVLIGPRGDTLSSLQYVTRLMVGHQLRQRCNFVVDVEGYRNRREQALRRLAERMADKVIKRGRAMTLEPMPPNERRIIHMTLRQHEEVDTHSVGEGDRRKVRIVQKK